MYNMIICTIPINLWNPMNPRNLQAQLSRSSASNKKRPFLWQVGGKDPRSEKGSMVLSPKYT